MPTELPARDSRVDALRGIAMLAVVLNHSLLAGEAVLSDTGGMLQWGLVTIGLDQVGVWLAPSVYDGALLNVVVTIHLALFAFLGGYVASVNSSVFALVTGRARRLLLPYASWMVVAVALVPSLRSDGWLDPLLAAAYNPHAAGALWFLPVYFVCLVFLWIVNTVGHGRVSTVWGSALIVAALSLFPHAPIVRYMGDIAWLYPFVALGFLSRVSFRVLPSPSPLRFAAAVALCGAGFGMVWPPLSGSNAADIAV